MYQFKTGMFASNPYSRIDVPPMHCGTACSYCIADYSKMFPPIIRQGACQILVDLYSGEKRISEVILFDPVLLNAIRKYHNCNRLLFGVNTNKRPTPIIVKKTMLMLLAAKILPHTHVKEVKETTACEDMDGTNNNTKVKIIIKAVLGYASTDNSNCRQYAINVDSYRSNIKQRPPLR